MLELSAVVSCSSIPTSFPIGAYAGGAQSRELVAPPPLEGASGSQIEAETLGQALDVAPVEELDADSRVKRSQLAQLAVLARHERLLHDRDLQVEILLGKVEVGREGLADAALGVAFEYERGGLVLPGDSVVIEDARAFGLGLVREPGGFRTAICLEIDTFEAHLQARVATGSDASVGHLGGGPSETNVSPTAPRGIHFGHAGPD